MKHLATLSILVVVAALFAPLSALPAVDWRPSEQGIYTGEIAESGDGDYYPLKVGNTWTYTLSGTKFAIKVVKYEQVAGMNCARVEMTQIGGGRVLSYEHIAVMKDGIYRVSFEGNQATPPVLILKRSPQVGQQWKINSAIGKEKITGTFKCGREARLKVGDKEHDAFYIESTDLDANGMKVKFKTYYAKNVGMVKQIITIGQQEIVLELEKFEPAK
jgi:hypothetical protein